MTNERVKMIDFQTKTPDNQDYFPGINPDGTHYKASIASFADVVRDEVVAGGIIGETNKVANLAMMKAMANAKVDTNKPEIVVDNKPLYVFSVNNDSSVTARQVVNAIYLDSLFNAKREVSLEGKGHQYINPKISGNSIVNVTSDVYTPVDPSVNNIVTLLSTVPTAKIMYMALGDSIAANEYLGVDSAQKDYWGYPSKAIYNILRDKIDRPALSTPLLLGHANVRTRTFSYKGNNITYKGGNAAYGGWPGASFLRHASRLTGVVTGSAGYIAPDISYYLLGLQAQTGAAYTATSTQLDLIRDSLQGKNSCDKNATLYNWMKVQSGWPGANDTYTATGTQTTNMNTYAESLLDSPANPFYSKTKARTGGATNAFSFSTYLSRYKTLASDGVTRLVVGSTAGTSVGLPYTQSTWDALKILSDWGGGTGAWTDTTPNRAFIDSWVINSSNVCLPTHISVNYGENDQWLFPGTTALQVAAIMREVANTIIAEYPTIKIGLPTYPRPGTNFPSLFKSAVRVDKPDTGAQKPAIRTELIANIGATTTITKSGNVYYVPTFEVTYPLNGMYEINGESAGTQIDFEIPESGAHLGIESLASIGDQIYAWIYYSTLN